MYSFLSGGFSLSPYLLTCTMNIKQVRGGTSTLAKQNKKRSKQSVAMKFMVYLMIFTMLISTFAITLSYFVF
ncbi:stressosome-associated protein Prli42 [Terribacillus saccharophilus]|uniref:stressosome-associated protein Prli42 n=1 Tax=Terribacillus saccharophilus TaxID=361277 RepID=UPI00398263CC